MSDGGQLHDDMAMPRGTLPGSVLGKGLLIVFAVVTIPVGIGVYISAEDLIGDGTALRSRPGPTSQSHDSKAASVSSIQLDAALGLTSSVVLLALAFAIDRYPLPALLAASSIYLGRFASFALVLPVMPWRWPWLFGLTVVAVLLSVSVLRSLLARRSEVADGAAVPPEVPGRACCTYWLAYLLVLATPVASLTIVTVTSPFPREPLDFLFLSAVNSAIIAVVVLVTTIVSRLPRPQLSAQASKRAWKVAPLFVCLLLGVALAYRHWLSQLLPDLADKAAMRDHAHLLLGWILVGCAVPAIVEEWLFRRLAMATLGPLMSVPVAILVSSTMFAAAHTLAPVNAPILFVLGIILGWSYVNTGRLLLPVLLHFGFNLALLTISVV